MPSDASSPSDRPPRSTPARHYRFLAERMAFERIRGEPFPWESPTRMSGRFGGLRVMQSPAPERGHFRISLALFVGPEEFFLHFPADPLQPQQAKTVDQILGVLPNLTLGQRIQVSLFPGQPHDQIVDPNTHSGTILVQNLPDFRRIPSVSRVHSPEETDVQRLARVLLALAEYGPVARDEDLAGLAPLFLGSPRGVEPSSDLASPDFGTAPTASTALRASPHR